MTTALYSPYNQNLMQNVSTASTDEKPANGLSRPNHLNGGGHTVDARSGHASNDQADDIEAILARGVKIAEGGER